MVLCLWKQSTTCLTEEEALATVFGSNPALLTVARGLYDWLKEILPFRCGVKMGKDRISFLIGNYRPAALKRRGKAVRLEMGFTRRLPEVFEPTGFVWRTVPDAVEGHIVVNTVNPRVALSEEHLKNFVEACWRMREAASKSRLHECNVSTIWPEDK